MHDIILGRSPSDSKKLETRGAVFIGKQYVQMGQTSSLSNSIYLDVARAHAMLIVGKRGGGKSYTMGSIAEGLADIDPEISKNLSFLMLDTMGVYWSMKYGNKKEDELLRKWGLEGKGLDVVICIPGGFFQQYQEDGIECDYPLYIKPKELSLEDWRLTFKLSIDDSAYILLSKHVGMLLKKGIDFDLEDIITSLRNETELPKEVVLSTIVRIEQAQSWGIFSKNARPIRDLLFRGKVTVLDFSAYVSLPEGWDVKALALGLIAKKIFIERMLVRKQEEVTQITAKTQIAGEREYEDDLPMPWLIIDEAHEFLPEVGETPATNALMTILREGRQPGVSLILATQQPAKIHTDAITQSDIVLAHRLTASFDLQSLDKIFLSYNSKGSKALFNQMPKAKGCAIIMDDKNERLYTMQVKPRISWHGGEDPSAIEEVEEEFDL